jgi:pyrimidine operon attenuation protein/uracil phosphoribosyltransferase
MKKQILIQDDEIDRIVSRMAHEILEKKEQLKELALIGIRSRGAYLAQRIARKIEALTGVPPHTATINVTPYRDDIEKNALATEDPSINVPLSVDGKIVVLIDDVIHTGRTIRSALDLTTRVGRPKKILVVVLIDRGNRELPIKADVVGRNVQVEDFERINVLLREFDGLDQVTVTAGREKHSNLAKP